MKCVVLCISVVMLMSFPALAQEVVSSPSKLERTKELVKQGSDERAQPKTVTESSIETSAVKMVSGLVGAIGVLLLLVVALKKIQKGGALVSNKKIKILERTPLSQRSALVLAEVDGERILLGVGSDPVTILHKMVPQFEMSPLEQEQQVIPEREVVS